MYFANNADLNLYYLKIFKSDGFYLKNKKLKFSATAK